MSPSYLQNGKDRYNIAMREPWQLPEDDINIPAPPHPPAAPGNISLLTLILPPAIMIAGTLISTVLMGNRSIFVAIPMALMGLGYPAANLITNKLAHKKYAEATQQRQQSYIQTLREVRSQIESRIELQRQVMEEEFPRLQTVLEIGMAAGKNRRMWWRRPNELDFLNLRAGTSLSALSFAINPPNSLTQADPLSELPFELIEHYETVDNLPFLVDLKRLGSLVIHGDSFRNVLRLIRRLLVDIIVHHSPEDVHVFVLADRLNAAEEYEWLKWVPHTHALDSSYEGRNLLFTTDHINNFLDVLKKIHTDRLDLVKGHSSNETRVPTPALVLLLDDNGAIRQHEDVRRIAEEGHRTGIYLLFLGNDSVPSTCRARIEIDNHGSLHYLETIELQGSGNQRNAQAELLQKKEIEPLARTLAGLEVIGGKNAYSLPSLVRVVDILEGDPYSVSDVVDRWSRPLVESEQLLLPIGQFVDRAGLSTFDIDFRPESKGGKGAYHAMMIGTTGSGKSIFMQSMVLAAAHKYSPRQINFMFMDFKAGAAELKKVADLPHSVGMVTDLSPQLADRALQALENELARRKVVFDNAGKITDIWDFNRRFPDEAMPQLMVVIDEFAEGINTLPNLVERLKELGRQGRAFGMYFYLANQEVNSAVDQLKANVSWYVLLKVNRQEEMNFIGKNLTVPPGRGRGYVRVKSDVTSVQSAYAGLPANLENSEAAEVEEYVLYTFGPSGERQELYRHDPRSHLKNQGAVFTELDMLVNTIKQASVALKIEKAAPIYLEPLLPVITLQQVMRQLDTFRQFNGTGWETANGERNILPLGYLDIPQRCQQLPFSLNFNEEGGHLWIIGTPGSGKNSVLLSLLSALALSHTPAEANVYVLDFGVGALSCALALPHTGAVIRAHETERIERLFRFLEENMSQRTETDWRSEGWPELYLVINNVADLRQQYPEQAEGLGRFIRSGGAVGIHVIITSNRGSELPRTLSGNITRRIVLQLTEKQDYIDIINKAVPPLTMRTEGRGYLMANGDVAECQVALADPGLLTWHAQTSDASHTQIDQTQRAKEQLLAEANHVVEQLGQQMRSAWQENLPKPIDAMQDELSLPAFQKSVAHSQHPYHTFPLPLGLYYDTLLPAIVDAKGEVPFWTILGPRQSGKSTLLLNFICQLLHSKPDLVCFDVLSLRKGLLSQLAGQDERVTVTTTTEDMKAILDGFPEKLAQHSDRFHVLVMDDLGLAFSSNNTALVSALNGLSDALNLAHHDNYLIVIADLYANLKNPQTFSSSFIKTFQQSQTGIFLSMDDADMQWFNTRINLQYKKRLKWLPGRGFLVYKGNTEFLQTPLITPAAIKALTTTEEAT